MPLCAATEVPKGTAVRVEVGDLELAVVHTDDGEFFAVDDICSHASFSLSDGDLDGCTLECALHGSRFDLRTGAPTGPPATEPVTAYPVRIVDGTVCAELPD